MKQRFGTRDNHHVNTIVRVITEKSKRQKSASDINRTTKEPRPLIYDQVALVGWRVEKSENTAHQFNSVQPRGEKLR